MMRPTDAQKAANSAVHDKRKRRMTVAQLRARHEQHQAIDAQAVQRRLKAEFYQRRYDGLPVEEQLRVLAVAALTPAAGEEQGSA